MIELIVDRIVVPIDREAPPERQVIDGFLCRRVFVEYQYQDVFRKDARSHRKCERSFDNVNSVRLATSRVYYYVCRVDSGKPLKSLTFRSFILGLFNTPYNGKPNRLSSWNDVVGLLEAPFLGIRSDLVVLWALGGRTESEHGEKYKVYYDPKTDKLIDLKTLDAVKSPQSPERISFFERSGGLIETPDVEQLTLNLRAYFVGLADSGLLVIVPDVLKWIWDGADQERTHILTHEELMERKKISVSRFRGCTLVIHELYGKMLPIVKRLATAVETKRILVINHLPLDAYFMEPKRLSLENAYRLVNLWAGWSCAEKEKNQEALALFIRHNLGSIFLTVQLQDSVERLPEVPPSIRLSPTEQKILDQAKSFRDRWLVHLDKEKLTIKKLDSINRNLSCRMIEAFSNIVIAGQSPSLRERFQEMHHLSVSILSKLDERLACMEKKYRMAHLTQDEMGKRTVIDLGLLLKTLSKQRHEIKTSLENHQRHLLNSRALGKVEESISPQESDDERFGRASSSKAPDRACVLPGLPASSFKAPDRACGVCYEETFPCLTACNHHLCLDCAIQSIGHSRSCPVCREELTMDRLLIIGSEKEGHLLDMLGTGNTTPSDVLVVTDLDLPDIGRNIVSLSTILSNHKRILESFSIVFLTSADESYRRRFQSRQLISYIQAVHQHLVDIRVIGI